MSHQIFTTHHLMKSLVGIVCLFISAVAVHAQTDSLTERRSNQNVLLNASSTSMPRPISLGVPEWGVLIMEDGLPAAMYRDFFPGHWSWHSGLATERMELTRLDESAIQLGSIGFYPMQTSKSGADSLEGAATYTLDHHGRHEVEVHVATPLGRGWSTDINMFQDFNRGPNHLDVAQYQERIQYYRAAVSKRLTKGSFQFSWLYMNKLDLSDPNGPFIFNGDGSVSEMDGFRLGRDQYLPATSVFDYVDIHTGEQRRGRFTEDLGMPIHALTASLDLMLPHDLLFDVRSRVRLGKAKMRETYLNGITKVAAGDGYSYENGQPYTGNVQSRMLLYYDDTCNEWLTTARLSKLRGRHRWQVGMNIWADWSKNRIMTSNFAHEAKRDPAQLLYQGEMYYIHNTSAQYVDGSERRYALFAQDQWRMSDKLNLHYGLRMEYNHISGDAAFNLNGQDNNTRTIGWSLQSPGVTITPFSRNKWNGAASIVGYYRLNRHVGLELDAIATMKHAELWQFGETEQPPRDAQPNYLLRGGVNIQAGWLDLQSLVTYFRQNSNYSTKMWSHTLTREAGGFPAGYNETIYLGSVFDMEVLGWTTDVVLTPFRGFRFHGLFTLRKPRYQGYHFRPTFSDGYSEDYDFSGKQITESSSVEMELEPSYEWQQWRFWMSARYYSRQYVNITNSLYLNPRWETFGGIDFRWNRHVELSASVINFLFSKGAKAGMQEASLATDVTPYRNYLTSGSYIRPFTLELTVKLKL